MRKFLSSRSHHLQIFSRTLHTLSPNAGNTIMSGDATTAKPKQKLNVHSFPRPPLCEPTDRALQIKWGDAVIANTKPGEAYWVLETTHPPSRLKSFRT